MTVQSPQRSPPGATWAEIAGVLDVSAQAAHKRFRWVRVDAESGVAWREPPLPR